MKKYFIKKASPILVFLLFSSCMYRNNNEPVNNNAITQDVDTVAVVQGQTTSDIVHLEEMRIIVSDNLLSDDEIKKIIRKVKNGDIEAYKTLSWEYSIANRMDELYPYAKLMADKYSVDEAYYDVYESIRRRNINRRTFDNKVRDLITLDRCTKKEIQIALDYLIKAYNNGSEESIGSVSDYYKKGIYFPKDSVFAKKIMESKVPLKLTNYVIE